LICVKSARDHLRTDGWDRDLIGVGVDVEDHLVAADLAPDGERSHAVVADVGEVIGGPR
jgi:hypothetical protein